MRILSQLSLLWVSMVGLVLGCRPMDRQFGAGGAGGGPTTSSGIIDPPDPIPGTGAGPCAPGQRPCSGGCVDVVSNSENCGECGHSCLGGACELSTCQPVVLAAGQGGPRGIAVDEQNVYWANENDGTVMGVRKSGGPVFKIATGQKTPSAVATDGTLVYWLSPVEGTVTAAPTSGGGQPVMLAS